MKDVILVSLYPILLLRGEIIRLAYLPLLIAHFDGTTYGTFLSCCCFVEISEIFLRKSKRFISAPEEGEGVPELWLCVYDVIFSLVFVLLSRIWYGVFSLSFDCDASRYISSSATDWPFVLCLSRYAYELFYVFRPKWFASRPTERNVLSLCLTAACVIFSATFGVWKKCLETLMAKHLLEAIESCARASAIAGYETAGVRLAKVHSVTTKIFTVVAVAVVANMLTRGGSYEDPMCEFAVLAIYAASTSAWLVETLS